jgi:hypothetical protein
LGHFRFCSSFWLCVHFLLFIFLLSDCTKNGVHIFMWIYVRRLKLHVLCKFLMMINKHCQQNDKLYHTFMLWPVLAMFWHGLKHQCRHETSISIFFLLADWSNFHFCNHFHSMFPFLWLLVLILCQYIHWCNWFFKLNNADQDTFEYVASILVNISKVEAGRRILMEPKRGLLKQIIRQFDSTNQLRKKGVLAA